MYYQYRLSDFLELVKKVEYESEIVRHLLEIRIKVVMSKSRSPVYNYYRLSVSKDSAINTAFIDYLYSAELFPYLIYNNFITAEHPSDCNL